jgi:hypothetical protein
MIRASNQRFLPALEMAIFTCVLEVRVGIGAERSSAMTIDRLYQFRSAAPPSAEFEFALMATCE